LQCGVDIHRMAAEDTCSSQQPSPMPLDLQHMLEHKTFNHQIIGKIKLLSVCCLYPVFKMFLTKFILNEIYHNSN